MPATPSHARTVVGWQQQHPASRSGRLPKTRLDPLRNRRGQREGVASRAVRPGMRTSHAAKRADPSMARRCCGGDPEPLIPTQEGRNLTTPLPSSRSRTPSLEWTPFLPPSPPNGQTK